MCCYSLAGTEDDEDNHHKSFVRRRVEGNSFVCLCVFSFSSFSAWPSQPFQLLRRENEKKVMKEYLLSDKSFPLTVGLFARSAVIAAVKQQQQ